MKMQLDTLAYTKRLEATGVERKAAEAHAEALLTLWQPEASAEPGPVAPVSGELYGWLPAILAWTAALVGIFAKGHG